MTSSLEIEPDFRSLRRLRPWLEDLVDNDDRVLGPIELCVHELAANVIDHSRATLITIDATTTSGHLIVRLTDDGRPAELTVSLDAHPRIGGYGLLIADQLAADLRYERIDDRNVWVASFDTACPSTHGSAEHG